MNERYAELYVEWLKIAQGARNRLELGFNWKIKEDGSLRNGEHTLENIFQPWMDYYQAHKGDHR